MRRLAALLVVCASAPAFAQSAEPSSDQWRAWAVEDVEAATNIYRQSHPGMFDPANPGFPGQLQSAHDSALKAAVLAKDAPSYSRALNIFSAGLRDGHAQVYSTEALKSEWAGLLPVWRANRVFVFRSEIPGVPKGAEVVSCDGIPVGQFIRDHVFATAGRPDEAGQWFVYTPFLFARSQATAIDRPHRCRFRMSNGAAVDQELEWRPLPADWQKWRRSATDGDANPLAITQPAPGIFHVGLSDFSPDAEGLKNWNSLLAELKRRDGELRNARAVILDLRHNNGGSSEWPKLVAEQLWGKQATDTALDNYLKGVAIRWLADAGNIKRFEAREADLRKIGDKSTADFIQQAVANLKSTLARGERFYVERNPPDKVVPPPGKPQALPPVYVVMPPGCASACLDAIDIFHLFPNVTLIGAPTSADSTYLEVVQESLPSGHGKISIPTKIWVGRPRGRGEIYEPAIPIESLDWSETAFVAAVEKDLAGRAAKGR